MKTVMLVFEMCIRDSYGAVLQCYALRKYLEKAGYDAVVLNAVSRIQEKNNSVFHKKDGVKNVLVNAVLLPFVKQRLKKEKGFADFVENYIPHTEKVVNTEQLKALVDREQYCATVSYTHLDVYKRQGYRRCT